MSNWIWDEQDKLAMNLETGIYLYPSMADAWNYSKGYRVAISSVAKPDSMTQIGQIFEKFEDVVASILVMTELN